MQELKVGKDVLDKQKSNHKKINALEYIEILKFCTSTDIIKKASHITNARSIQLLKEGVAGDSQPFLVML